MDEDDTLTRLQGLQADLVAISESRLANVNRLWVELEGSIADFRKLLDQQHKNDKSRQALKLGMFKCAHFHSPLQITEFLQTPLRLTVSSTA